MCAGCKPGGDVTRSQKGPRLAAVVLVGLCKCPSGGQSLSKQAVIEAPSRLLMQEILPELSFHLCLALSASSPTQDDGSCIWAPPTQPAVASNALDIQEALSVAHRHKSDNLICRKDVSKKRGPTLNQHKLQKKTWQMQLPFTSVYNVVFNLQLSGNNIQK